MAVNADDIVGTNAAAPSEEAPVQEATAEGELTELPDELKRIPALVPLFEGKPPATYATQADQNLPELQSIAPNIEALADFGFGVFMAPDESVEVLYNSAHIEPQEVQLAFEQGRLEDIAIPFADLVNQTRAAKSEPAEEPPAAPAAAPQPAGPPPPAGVTERLATTRLRNIALGSPTSGPNPGSGRILNAIQKPVV